jgi:hypothetical protein
MKKRTEKIDQVVALAKKLMAEGAYVISNHAFERGEERRLSIGDIKNIIDTGYHEKRKDEYKEEFKDWNYAIRGKTLDQESARVCLAFVKRDRFVVITVIRL